MADGIARHDAVRTLDAGEPRPGEATRASRGILQRNIVGALKLVGGLGLFLVGMFGILGSFSLPATPGTGVLGVSLIAALLGYKLAASGLRDVVD